MISILQRDIRDRYILSQLSSDSGCSTRITPYYFNYPSWFAQLLQFPYWIHLWWTSC